MTVKKEKNKNDYKVIISELGINPFHVVNMIFALMCIVPLLVVCYILIGKHFLYRLFMGIDGLQITIALFVALTGLFYAYNLTKNLIEKLLIYADDRRRADNERSEFMTSVSRDLRIPVEVIKFEMANIMAGVGTIVGGIIEETVKKCLDATDKLADLVENIMDFPNIGFVRMNVQRKLIDFRDIIKGELADATQMAKKNNLDLRCRFATDNANLWGDEKKLSKMSMNLISNAIKYTPRGGVVNVLVQSDADTVQFSVGNAGPGLLSEKMERLFEKEAGPEKYAGMEDSAVEISAVNDIVELHNGHITLNSKQDKETEFKVVLPRDLRAKSGLRESGPKISEGSPLAANGAISMAEILNTILTDLASYKKPK